MLVGTLLTFAFALTPIDAHAASITAARLQHPESARQWIRSRLEPIRIGHDEGATVPAGIARVVRGARVIGLGESAHHKSELQVLRFQLTRELVRRHGVRAVAMETGYADALLLDDWLRQPAAREPDLSTALPYAGDGDQEELRSTLRWLKEYNAAQPAALRVRFIGIDMSNGGGALRPPLERAWEYLDRVDGERARASRSRLAAALDHLGAGYSRTAQQRFDSLTSNEREQLGHEVASLRDRLERRRSEYVRSSSPSQHEQARHALEVAAQTLDFMRHDDRDPSNPRDRALTTNVLWALSTLPAGARLVVWAHNAHVQKQEIDVPAMRMATPPASMGTLLQRRLGHGYRAIGTVVDRFLPDSTHADPGSLDALFASVGRPSYFLGLRDGGENAAAPLSLRTSQPMRFETLYIRVAAAKAFDGLVFVDSASPGTVRPR
jgi:erythromycin esterase